MKRAYIDYFLQKNKIEAKQRIERPNGGQYLDNLLIEFAEFVRNETLIEVESKIKKIRRFYEEQIN